MRSRGVWITAGVALLAVGAIEVGGAHATGSAKDARAGSVRPHARVARKLGHHRIVVWARGSWCWFQDPRAVNVTTPRDKTFVGWIDWRGSITVGAYKPGAGVIESHVVGHQAVDDHGSPSILVEPDGRLTVFWSGHDGPRMNYRTTRRPEDISSWTHVRHVHSGIPGGRGFTYPNPVMLPAERNKLYLFFRGADWSSDFATRTRSGRWSRVRRLISVPGLAGTTPPWSERPGGTICDRSCRGTAIPAGSSCCGCRATTAATRITGRRSPSCAEEGAAPYRTP
jgi:BNR repeat-containing family member